MKDSGFGIKKTIIKQTKVKVKVMDNMDYTRGVDYGVETNPIIPL